MNRFIISLLLVWLWVGQAWAQNPAVNELLRIEGFGLSAIDVAWSPDGTQIAVASGDSLVKTFNAESGDLIYSLSGHGREAVSVSYSHDGAWLASSDLAGRVLIWDVATGENLHSLSSDSDFVNAVRWSPNDAWLVLAVDRISDPNNPQADDFQIQIWETATWTRTQTLMGHQFGTSDLQWSPNGAQLASVGIDGRLRIWDTSSWETTGVMGIVAPISGFTSVAWSPDGTQVVTAHFNNNLQIWDIASEEQLQVLQGHRDFVGHVAWFGNRIASASGSPISEENDNAIRLWNAETGELLIAIGAHENGVRAVAWSPDGTKLASAGDDNTVKIWSVQ